ncbi:MAG: phospho-sugar mutase [Schaalia hyovaginalis]|uniref:phospho-sugar mutase n=1 Tax=Schaalia hyovaginalis TaxID=29316 RepID=UPI0012B3DB32|nr:phospho-sugar mutase [Schaalia hyovaginalis]MCI6411143.1 phospho-sugar mutase [Schaalia hyovaginalis]MCI7512936.1 phospho-sugar mutase [Schaalia hyovaginalis]MDY4262200.1 phospho-sugar mutase [Schaalia hyovaginalis]MDY4492495.1 phospho-sugar mutase [Schaalia hyovaginalis]MST64083.1 phospho-sugar mutase [Schaalia hyovaginalis]
MNDQLLATAREWAAHDPDGQTSSALLASIEAASAGDEGALAELRAAMNGPLEFGTAGLRGEIGPGESRMNLAVVIRATAGLAAYLKTQTEREPRVVIGCDARHGSVDFARAAARVVSAAGCRALALPLSHPTPLTSFAVRALDADAGIMITASHNPAKDNGYKVYLGGSVVTDAGQGAQIVPPHDAGIAAAIAAAAPADEVPQDEERIEQVDPRDDYVAAAAALATGEHRGDLKITLTAMHGVGGALTERVLKEAGFTQVSLVAEQAAPDPDFPTVSFPNPEEPGALDLAMAHAREHGSDLIIAVDPDADRCALAIPDEESASGWRQLTGDETGSILGEFLAERAPKGGVFANSIVSSRQLERIAAAHGLDYRHTLTGFKWIARTPGIVFGYEEAIGFCPDPEHARDKDGISTSVVAASLFAELKAQGRTGQDELERMARAYGCYVTMPLTFRVENLGLIAEGMDRLRENPPAQLAGSPVVSVVDMSQGWDGLPGTNAIMVTTEANDRVIARPSGTEPKLKCYLEVILPVEEGAPVPWSQARERLETIKAEFGAAIGI